MRKSKMLFLAVVITAANLPCAADIAGHASWKSGNSASKAGCLRSEGLTPDQRLAYSDQDWHTGRLAR
jgi:hypothetical protein